MSMNGYEVGHVETRLRVGQSNLSPWSPTRHFDASCTVHSTPHTRFKAHPFTPFYHSTWQTIHQTPYAPHAKTDALYFSLHSLRMVPKSLIACLLSTCALASTHAHRNQHRRHHDLAKKQDSYGYMSVGYYVRPPPFYSDWRTETDK